MIYRVVLNYWLKYILDELSLLGTNLFFFILCYEWTERIQIHYVEAFHPPGGNDKTNLNDQLSKNSVINITSRYNDKHKNIFLISPKQEVVVVVANIVIQRNYIWDKKHYIFVFGIKWCNTTLLDNRNLVLSVYTKKAKAISQQKHFEWWCWQNVCFNIIMIAVEKILLLWS